MLMHNTAATTSCPVNLLAEACQVHDGVLETGHSSRVSNGASNSIMK